MCGCEKHQNKKAECTCICPAHKNFEMAYDLAMERYDTIVALSEKVGELEASRDEWAKLASEAGVREQEAHKRADDAEKKVAEQATVIAMVAEYQRLHSENPELQWSGALLAIDLKHVLTFFPDTEAPTEAVSKIASAEAALEAIDMLIGDPENPRKRSLTWHDLAYAIIPHLYTRDGEPRPTRALDNYVALERSDALKKTAESFNHPDLRWNTAEYETLVKVQKILVARAATEMRKVQ